MTKDEQIAALCDVLDRCSHQINGELGAEVRLLLHEVGFHERSENVPKHLRNRQQYPYSWFQFNNPIVAGWYKIKEKNE